MASANFINSIYLVSAVLFMLGLKNLSSPATAKRGNTLSMTGMALAIIATLMTAGLSFKLIFIGIAIGAIIGGIAAVKVEMTSMPEMVALFNGCGGAASALVALSEFQLKSTAHGADMVAQIGGFSMTTLLLSVIIGALTFTGSIIAYAK